MTFESCAESACGYITIVNDDEMDTLVENFTVSLERVETDSRYRVSAQPSIIHITDDDGVCCWTLSVQYFKVSLPTGVRIRMVSHRLRTREGTVAQVCAAVSGRSHISNTVHITLEPGTAGISA